MLICAVLIYGIANILKLMSTDELNLMIYVLTVLGFKFFLSTFNFNCLCEILLVIDYFDQVFHLISFINMLNNIFNCFFFVSRKRCIENINLYVLMF